MPAFDQRLTRQFDRRLAARETELCALLAAREAAADAIPMEPLCDFQDCAARDAFARLDAARVERAALELEEVVYARARLHDHSFGLCTDCEDPIPLARLRALPAANRCAECQARLERRRDIDGETF